VAAGDPHRAAVYWSGGPPAPGGRIFLSLTAILLTSATPEVAAGEGDARAQRLADRAGKDLAEGRIERAFKRANKALARDPENGDACAVRGMVLMGATQVPDNPVRDQMMADAEQMLACAAAYAPASPLTAAAREIYSSIAGVSLVPEPDFECPAPALQSLAIAEQLFGVRDLEAAGIAYAQALDICPEAVPWWTMYGDVFFLQGENERAMEMYRRSLELDPCYWTAHRFLADALAEEGHEEEAHHHLALALSCNPDYSHVWDDLEDRTEGLRRPDARRPPTRAVEGNPALSLARRGAFSGPVGVLYGPLKLSAQGEIAPLGDGTLAPPEERTPLAVERFAVRGVLAMLRQLDDGFDDPDYALWRLLDAAEREGYLDEAIFILMLDEALVPEFLEYREAHLHRLSDYVERHLAPLR
jgi:tetratricopeptide (TPR) repeat protein